MSPAPPLQRIALTGSSGYLGRCFLREIRAAHGRAVKVLGLDIAPPDYRSPCPDEERPDEFVKVDMRDKDGLLKALSSFGPDTVLHFAFVIDVKYKALGISYRDEDKMHDININGTRNVIECVDALRPARFLTTTSVVAFGASSAVAGGKCPLGESAPREGDKRRVDFIYARHKYEQDCLIDEYYRTRPAGTIVSWVRPAIVYGPNVQNWISNLATRYPFVPSTGTLLPLQFVHEDDVARGVLHVVTTDGAHGPFNLGPPPPFATLADCAEIRGCLLLALSPLLVRALLALEFYVLRTSDLPPNVVSFFSHEFTCSSDKLVRSGFTFKYSTRDAIEQFLTASIPPPRVHRPQIGALLMLAGVLNAAVALWSLAYSLPSKTTQNPAVSLISADGRFGCDVMLLFGLVCAGAAPAYERVPHLCGALSLFKAWPLAEALHSGAGSPAAGTALMQQFALGTFVNVLVVLLLLQAAMHS
jgi:UDP-glucose 4-epimerase